MSDKVYNVPAEWASRAFIDNEKYLAMYKRSVEDPHQFWGEAGKRAVFFHDGGASETCTGTYWYQCYPENEWWGMAHAEPFLLRSYAETKNNLGEQDSRTMGAHQRLKILYEAWHKPQKSHSF